MKVTDSNLSSLSSTASTGASATARAQETDLGQAGLSTNGAGDDVHLSELVRSLRALAANSPERQARLEQLARSYANGTYHADAEGTASKMIDDALEP